MFLHPHYHQRWFAFPLQLEKAESTAGGNFALNSEVAKQTGNFMPQPWWGPTELSYLRGVSTTCFP